MRHFTVWRWNFDNMTIQATKHFISNDEEDVKKSVKRMNLFVAKNAIGEKYAYLYRERTTSAFTHLAGT